MQRLKEAKRAEWKSSHSGHAPTEEQLMATREPVERVATTEVQNASRSRGSCSPPKVSGSAWRAIQKHRKTTIIGKLWSINALFCHIYMFVLNALNSVKFTQPVRSLTAIQS